MRPYRIDILLAVATSLATSATFAEVTVRIADVAALKGLGVNHLVGTGLVVGLNGTGDGDQYEATMRQLARALGNMGSPINGIEELKDTANVAIVWIDAVIPEHGAREGDRIDAHISAIGSCKSLAGGRLITAPLIYRDPSVGRVFAFASGPIRVVDPDRPTVGEIARGALINEDVLIGFTARGHELPFANAWIKPAETYITYVLDESHAGWGLAVAIAEAVNSELSLAADVERVALAADSKNVVVWVPPFQSGDPAAWIRDIGELSTLMPPTEARVTIDRASGTIVVSGETRISPVIVSHKGMTVVVSLPPPPIDEPRLESQQFVGIDTEERTSANAAELLQALNQLKVPIDDRIAILTEIQRAGKLHAKLIFKE